jgi:hypothetical protein
MPTTTLVARPTRGGQPQPAGFASALLIASCMCALSN